METMKRAPKALGIWFTIHFIADVLFALPLFIIPVKFLTMLGWTSVDPVGSRMVASALFGIGIESLLSRNTTISAFKVMLNLKIIWSISAIIGLSTALIIGAHNRPPALYGILLVFILFNILWIYWRIRLSQLN